MPTADELLGREVVEGLAARLDGAGLPSAAVRRSAARLAGLALRERCDLVHEALLEDLPADTGRAVRELLTDNGFTGWMTWPVTEAVVTRALAAPDPGAFDGAMHLLADLTGRLTAEFALRRMLVADLDRALAIALRWTAHPDEHVRRLASEGTRPRLPWAVRVPAILARPEATLPIVRALHRDPSEYVRRSAANHVNDLSHAHPDLAVAVAEEWAADADEHTPKVIGHALRTLVKRGDQRALALLGFTPATALVATGPRLGSPEVAIGSSLRFSFELENRGDEPCPLVVDYVVHHRKANGSLSPKVFKLTKRTLAPGRRVTITREHPFKRITTRVLHPGEHAIELQVNGIVVGERATFRLLGD